MATFEFTHDWVTELDNYVTRLQSEALAAATKAAYYLHDTVVHRALQDPEGWSMLADNIETWSQDGYLVIGVRNEDFVSEAFALEYGDEVRPPNPLFRTINPDIRNAGGVMRDHMVSVFPERFV